MYINNNLFWGLPLEFANNEIVPKLFFAHFENNCVAWDYVCGSEFIYWKITADIAVYIAVHTYWKYITLKLLLLS